jgi:hypothetical protein
LLVLFLGQLKLLQRLQMPTLELVNLGQMQPNLGLQLAQFVFCRQYERAREFYTRALAVARRDNDQIGLARMLERLGDLGFDEGHREHANASWVEALKIREGLHHSEEANALRERIRGGRPPRR